MQIFWVLSSLNTYQYTSLNIEIASSRTSFGPAGANQLHAMRNISTT